MLNSKKIFYILLFFLPTNLGLHFESNFSYVNGILIDYLIPTIYIQDILIFILLSIYFYEAFNNSLSIKQNIFKVLKSFFNAFSDKRLFLFYFFIFSVFLSAFGSEFSSMSLLFFTKKILYFLLFLYVFYTFDYKKDFNFILKIIVLSMSLVSILGIIQFIIQSSVFNNYLFFGEQPYNISTPNILRESLFGSTKVPSYGLFRHPNIFAGFLSITIIFAIKIFNKKKYFIPLIIILVTSLLFTFSLSGIISLLFGLLLYFLYSKFSNKNLSFYLIPLMVTLIILSIIFPFLIKGADLNTNYVLGANQKDTNYFLIDDSIIFRSNLIKSTFNMLKENFTYGVGYGLYTKKYSDFIATKNLDNLKFIQPVHNIYLLILSESGIISFVIFILIILYLLGLSNTFIDIAILQVLFLGLFDHYFLTIHQSNLLLWIIFGICCRIKLNNNYN